MDEANLVYSVLKEISKYHQIVEVNGYSKYFCDTLEELIDDGIVSGSTELTKMGRIFQIRSISKQAIEFMENFE